MKHGISRQISFGDYEINTIILVPIVLVLSVAAIIVFLLSSGAPQKAPEFTESECIQKLELNSGFFEKSTYQESVLDLNIDRSSSKEVKWRIYQFGQATNLNLVKDVKISAITVYSVVSGKFQGCGKISINETGIGIPPSSRTLRCNSMDVYAGGKKFKDYLYTDQYGVFKNTNTTIKNTVYVTKEFASGMIRYVNSTLDSLGCVQR